MWASCLNVYLFKLFIVLLSGLFTFTPSSFVSISFVSPRILIRWCNAFSLPPPDFSERLKIWNFGKDKKVSSRRGDVQQKKKIRKKSFFRPLGRFSYHLVYVVDCAGFFITILAAIACYYCTITAHIFFRQQDLIIASYASFVFKCLFI